MVNSWLEKQLGEIGTFSKGGGVNRADSNSGKLPCVRYGEIYTVHNDYIKVFTSHISIEVAQNATLLKKGDLLFTGSGETKEEIGKCVAFVDNFEAYAGGDIIILSPNIEVDPLFMGFLLNTPIVNRQKTSKGQGDAIVHITAKALADVVVNLPPIEEQKAIAGVLSDADKYIGAIEKLIAKKRAIKQGVMQQLLTGKRRLTGFNSQWTEKNINDLGNVITGRTPSTANKEYWNGSIAWVTPTDISFTKNIYKSERMVTECGIKQICELPPNTLLVTCIASIGKNTILRVRGATNQQINAVIPFDDFDVDFLYYVLEINKQALLQKAGQTATNIISKTEFSTIVFKIPPTLAEQQAIAKILSDIDAQIDALIAKLNKAKNIKQGIAQKLLTGKIRLPQRIANG